MEKDETIKFLTIKFLKDHYDWLKFNYGNLNKDGAEYALKFFEAIKVVEKLFKTVEGL